MHSLRNSKHGKLTRALERSRVPEAPHRTQGSTSSWSESDPGEYLTTLLHLLGSYPKRTEEGEPESGDYRPRCVLGIGLRHVCLENIRETNVGYFCSVNMRTTKPFGADSRNLFTDILQSSTQVRVLDKVLLYSTTAQCCVLNIDTVWYTKLVERLPQLNNYRGRVMRLL